MSRICVICEKTYQQGNLVPRGIGNRVTKRTTTHNNANLRNKRIQIDGRSVRVKLCASCLKRLKKEIAEHNQEHAEVKTVVAAK